MGDEESGGFTFVEGPLLLTPPQIESVRLLNNSTVPACNELTAEMLAALLREAAVVVVAFDGPALRTVAGFVIAMGRGAAYESPNYQYFCRAYDDATAFCYVDRIVVAPAFYRRGLGRKLYREAAAGFRVRRGMLPGTAVRVCCEVNLEPPNEDSMQFHRRLGFEQIDTQVVYGGSKTVAMLECVM